MDHTEHHSSEGNPIEYLKFILVLIGITLLALAVSRIFSLDFMRSFMGSFFIVFALFKLLDLPGFVMSYIGYDIIASKFNGYAYIFPFIELFLGIGSFINFPYINYAILIITMISAIGVIKQLLRKSKIKCACLGTYIKLPLTTVSLVEDLGMGIMALILLLNK
jgi:hypothetical protein